MMPFSSLPEVWQNVFYVMMVLVITATIAFLVSALIHKTPNIIRLFLGLFLASQVFFLWVMSVDYAEGARGIHIIHEYSFCYSLPVSVVWLYLGLFVLLDGLVAHYVHGLWFRQLDESSIKESLDTIPDGLCFHQDNGLPLLTNNAMHEIIATLTGHTVLDAVRTWNEIQAGRFRDGAVTVEPGARPIIKLADGTVHVFMRKALAEKTTTLYVLQCFDVTRLYALGQAITEESRELAKMNERLVQYGDDMVRLVREKELLAAKVRIHDDLGELLLALRKSLVTETSPEEQNALAERWSQGIRLLESTWDHPAPSAEEDLALSAASIGVTLVMKGKLPPDEAIAKVFTRAIHESLTNAVKHAHGKTLTVVVSQEESGWTLTCTNDGDVPSERIVEGGGLTNLRHLVENAHGEMTASHAPVFMLTLHLPKESS